MERGRTSQPSVGRGQASPQIHRRRDRGTRTRQKLHLGKGPPADLFRDPQRHARRRLLHEILSLASLRLRQPPAHCRRMRHLRRTSRKEQVDLLGRLRAAVAGLFQILRSEARQRYFHARRNSGREGQRRASQQSQVGLRPEEICGLGGGPDRIPPGRRQHARAGSDGLHVQPRPPERMQLPGDRHEHRLEVRRRPLRDGAAGLRHILQLGKLVRRRRHDRREAEPLQHRETEQGLRSARGLSAKVDSGAGEGAGASYFRAVEDDGGSAETV
mmetsp:Transcript_39351/g.91846  ORF Transcript_39351/g.91846 Transcript_39351/m.91846 type:complete len:272 (-) Transcript_39351:419-1234(-)